MEENKKIDQSVTSYNQSGGVTAHTVNIGKQERKLNESLKNQLANYIKESKSVRITAVLGDPEALQFATEIKSYLESKGYKVEGVDQAVYTEPVKGQILTKKEGRIEIIIGKAE